MTVALIYSHSANASAEAPNTDKTTFVEECLDKTQVLDQTLQCKVTLEDDNSVLSFTLNKSRELQITGTGQFGSFAKNFNIQRITHLHPRVTPNGVISESIRFYGENMLNTNRATLTLPCHQQDIAYVGLARANEPGLPEEMVAACELK